MDPRLNNLIRAPYYDAYLGRIQSYDVKAELQHSLTKFVALLKQLDDTHLGFKYADDKWSIAQVIQHVIETEMIFNFRAIAIGRELNDQTIEGFDENLYADQAELKNFGILDWQEFATAVRCSTSFLYQTFNELQLKKSGIASGHHVQVEALFFITAGHTYHHCEVLKSKYLNALNV